MQDKKKKKKKKVPFSKKLLVVFFINCIILEIFTGIVTIMSLSMAISIGTFPDFTPLITLIGEVVGQAVGYAIYCTKATKENTKGGIVYEQAMLQDQSKEEIEEGGELEC